ncbi:MAG: FMN-binding protein [Thermoanaerobaculia bacterium]|nr:FMN-binding protein [Thermoanaerobaculia bacterium]
MTPPRGSLLGQAWLILILGILFGGALVGVHTGLAPKIAANQRAETLRQLPGLVLPAERMAGATVSVAGDRIAVRWAGEEALELAVAESAVAGHQLFTLAGSDGAPLGYVVRGKGPGYADEIDLLVGLSGDLERLTGIFVLAQKETPALGDEITKEPFRRWFAGAPAARPLEVVKSEAQAGVDEGRVLALTAATISSRSVCDIVNATVAAVRPQLAAATPVAAAAEEGETDGGR